MAPIDIVNRVIFSLLALGLVASLAQAAVSRLGAGPIVFRLGIASGASPTDRGQGRATKAKA